MIKLTSSSISFKNNKINKSFIFLNNQEITILDGNFRKQVCNPYREYLLIEIFLKHKPESFNTLKIKNKGEILCATLKHFLMLINLIMKHKKIEKPPYLRLQKNFY
jgi:hypothetical protein